MPPNGGHMPPNGGHMPPNGGQPVFDCNQLPLLTGEDLKLLDDFSTKNTNTQQYF